ncbi:MAG: MFS transporter, partial [Terriglobus roseus]|nr:MFS transporter [Terriglobus roseus]
MLSATKTDLTLSRQQRLYGRLLLLVAGLGGLLYGVDVGIIGGALPYLVATAHLTTSQLSMVVAAVLLGSVLSTLFAGVLADAMGRRNILVLSGLAFIVSIPVIALSQSYASLFLGRVLQGMSGGLIGVVVPLYLAECLGADVRGKGAGLFQWLLTLGIFLAALIGIFYSYRVEAIQRLGDPQVLFQFQDSAWRHIFWASLPPGVLFVVGSFLLSESPRWLVQKRRPEQALQALLRSLPEAEARLELNEITAAINTDSGAPNSIQTGAPSRSRSLLQRKYVVPFLIACAVLFCNTATGINSIIGYNTNILLQSGLGDV